MYLKLESNKIKQLTGILKSANIFYTVFSNSIRVVGCLILVFYINPLLSTICVFFLCLYIIWIIFIGEKIKSLTNRIQLSKEKIIQTSDNILYNILPIRIYSLFSNSYSKYYKSIEDNANFVKKLEIILTIFPLFRLLLFQLQHLFHYLWG
ncbi:ABC transporter transmembrane domain-containing protein [Streptococcus porcinus]|nr:ABC transporter transmembrane region [Streptococcus porcinus]VTT43150.1 ABC transporter transmembrane region [Streptococcus porcinus]